MSLIAHIYEAVSMGALSNAAPGKPHRNRFRAGVSNWGDFRFLGNQVARP